MNVGTGNSSPSTTQVPIIQCPLNGICQFTVAAADPNGDTLRYRLATSAEAGGFTQPGPPQAPNAASIDPVTGVYTWDTTGATTGTNTLYSTAVMVEDATSRAVVDFLINLVTQPVTCGPPPTIDPPTPCGQALQVAAGDTLSFTLAASDVDGDQTVTLSAVGLPPAAVLTPGLPTTGAVGGPVNATFDWTPSAADVGSSVVIVVTATDNCPLQPLQTTCNITIDVISAVRITTITFDGTPFHAPLCGEFDGVDWLCGHWRTWGGQCGACQGPLAFPDFLGPDPYNVAFEFVSPSTLLSFDASYHTQDGFVVVTTFDAGGAQLEQAAFNVTTAQCQTFVTGFTQSAVRVEWTVQFGADLALDNVTYQTP